MLDFDEIRKQISKIFDKEDSVNQWKSQCARTTEVKRKTNDVYRPQQYSLIEELVVINVIACLI